MCFGSVYTRHSVCMSQMFILCYAFAAVATTILRTTVMELLYIKYKYQDILFVNLDLSGAFDTVGHDILFFHLRLVFGIALSWLKSYLTNRF